MLYVFSGNDMKSAKAKVRSLATGSELVVFGEGGESFGAVVGFLGAQGLFSPKAVLLIDRPLESSEGKTLLEEHATALHESDCDVFVLEPGVTATFLKTLPKTIKKEVFGSEEEKTPPPNVFAFTDAFLSGNRKNAWILFRQLVNSGMSPEEIHGALSWAIRSTLLASKTKNASESGLKPFVHTKSKRAADTIGLPTVEALSRSLVAAYHNARRGQGSMESLLEHVILSPR